MKLIINLIRNLLGGFIAIVDFITRGAKLKRAPEAQQRVEAELEKLSLFQFFACPFCIKTRRAMHKLNLPIVKRNASQGSPFREELLQGGGKIQTPCLRIEKEEGVEWLYDSKEIITYLQNRFA
ncbi:glutathione S-transferase N-terminal domain-containing protein [uncultured Paraglaciecola sp.]|uniref:glutathione S-transferase N-terminal domain-containing protein n=1 Tax=uncultured Paraglaciecola sp. TaxID=1765024 RepID=UPI002617541D|nr:glutathione S-transferase N-terminal domain-containing protein [uncultured Paraglaciecola sp.]